MATNKDFIIKNGLVVGGDITGVTDLYVDDQIISTGDTNTYLQFHSADQFRVVTGGVERLEVNGNGIGVVGDIKIGTTTVIESNRNLSNVVTATVNTLHVRGDSETGYGVPGSMLGGLSLWGAGATTSQMMFKPIGSGSLGNHGFCTDYYNTYFVMDTTNRGLQGSPAYHL